MITTLRRMKYGYRGRLRGQSSNYNLQVGIPGPNKTNLNSKSPAKVLNSVNDTSRASQIILSTLEMVTEYKLILVNRPVKDLLACIFH